ncbi:NAD(P)/FAD-dependent oxidoreductase [Tabrizicola sp.]|uniref:NAD(P)/FAD-dependent oxidoreductase n=1 Tax=Tabrizicola sp. TaxID=2005166 RepID=UPI003F330A2F
MTEVLDVAIVGGSFAGLTAALQLGRASRQVAVFDTGRPRNAASPAAHGVPGWDGRAPADILAAIRGDLAAYPTVSLRDRAVTGLSGEADAFRLTTAVGEVMARRVILACGVTDRLPDIPGLAEGWGTWALHCPYCHGYEIKGQPLSILGRGPMALHMARMLRTDWSQDVSLIAHEGDLGPDAEAETAALGVGLLRSPLIRAEPESDGARLTLVDGTSLYTSGLFLHADTAFAAPFVADLGLATIAGPTGPYLKTGAFNVTSRAGIFAAGDIIRPAGIVTPALADGAITGTAAHQSLIWTDRFPPLQET